VCSHPVYHTQELLVAGGDEKRSGPLHPSSSSPSSLDVRSSSSSCFSSTTSSNSTSSTSPTGPTSATNATSANDEPTRSIDDAFVRAQVRQQPSFLTCIINLYSLTTHLYSYHAFVGLCRSGCRFPERREIESQEGEEEIGGQVGDRRYLADWCDNRKKEEVGR